MLVTRTHRYLSFKALAGVEVRAETNKAPVVNSYVKTQGQFLVCEKGGELIKVRSNLVA